MRNFSLDLTVLRRIPGRFKGNMDEIRNVSRGFTRTGDELTQSGGWSGQAATSFRARNTEWNRSANVYMRNLENFHTMLKRISQRADTIADRIVAITSIFGATISRPNIIGYNDDAGSDARLRIARLRGMYNSDLSDLESVANTLNSLTTTRINHNIGATTRRIDTIFGQLNSLSTAIVDYRNDVAALERLVNITLAQIPEWTNFTQAVFTMTGMDPTDLMKDQNALNALLAALLGVNYRYQFAGDPVNMSTGNFIYQKKYLEAQGDIPLFFLATYNALEKEVGTLGEGWRHSFEVRAQTHYGRATIILEDGQRVNFVLDDSGNYINGHDPDTHLEEVGDTLVFTNTDNCNYIFSALGKIQEIKYKDKNLLTFTHNNNQLEKVTSSTGISYHFTYRGKKLTKVVDNTKREITLTYKKDSLHTITDEEENTYTFDCDPESRITHIKNPLGITAVKNTFDEKDRVTTQHMPGGGTFDYLYEERARATTLSDQRGNEVVYRHDDMYRSTEVIYSDGREKTHYNKEGQLASITDKLGNSSHFAYDENNNLITYTNALEEIARTEYDSEQRPTRLILSETTKLTATYKEQQTTIKDALQRATTISKDTLGKIVKVTLPDKSKVELSYDKRGNVTSATDLFGTTLYKYDSLNRPIVKIDAKGNETLCTYDLRGNIKSITNALGHTKHFEYNVLNRLTKVVDFDGQTVLYGYNKAGQRTSVTDKSGNTAHFTYDKCANITSHTDEEGAVTHFKHNELNQLASVTDATGNIVARFEYDANGNRTAFMDAASNTTHFEHDALNRATKAIDALGNTTSTEYDSFGNITSQTDALDNIYQFAYDKADQLTKTTNPLGQSIYYTYSNLGQVASVKDSAGREVKLDYFPGGLLKQVSFPDNTFEKYTYNENKNLITITNQAKHTTRFEYDSLGQVVSVNKKGQVTHYSYDTLGNVESVTDALKNTTKYVRDALSKVVEVIDAEGNSTCYKRDKRGQITSVTQVSCTGESSRITTYTRDILGRVIEERDALGNFEHFTYNTLGKLASSTDKDGHTTKYTYNALGHIEKITYADGKTSHFTHNALGQLTEVRDESGTTAIELDALGRAIKVTDPKGRTTEYTYGDFNERTSLIYPSGEKLNFSYDQYLRLSKLSRGDVNIDYTYDTNSNLSEKHFSNGVSAKYSYNNQGLLESVTHSDSQGTLDSFNYSYNDLFQQIGIVQNRRDLTDTNGNYNYSYDSLSRLCSVTKDKQLLKHFEYDEFSNLVAITEEGTLTKNTFNLLHQLTTSTTNENTLDFIYDKRGNTTEILENGTPIQSYTFNAFNRLESATDKSGTTTKYFYSALGSKIAETTTGDLNPKKHIEYVLDITKQFDNVISIESADTTKDYLWDTGIVAEVGDSSTHSYLRDHLGSPLRFIDSQGSITDSYSYGEFGQDLSHNQNTQQPFGFTGYSFDKAANTYFAQARHYDPHTARFISADIHWDADNRLYGDKNFFLPDTSAVRQSSNLYGYCLSDPLNKVDRLGLWGGWHAEAVQEWGNKFEMCENVVQEIIYGNKEIDFPVLTPAYWGAVNSSGLMTNPVVNVNLSQVGNGFSWTGALHGAITGAVAGGLVAGPGGAIAGAVVGGVAGGVIDFQIAGPGQAYHFNRQHDEGAVNALSHMGVNANVDTRLSLSNFYFWVAVEGGCANALGRALHPLQDFFAHGNIGLHSGSASHRMALFGGGYDNDRFDWADCTLTSVKLVGEGSTNDRVTSADLATGGMMALWNFKTGRG